MKSLNFCKIFVKWGVGNSEGEGDFEILLLFYSEIELAFQIINITMVFIRILMFPMFECLCYSFCFMFMLHVYVYGFILFLQSYVQCKEFMCVCGGRFVIKWGWGVDF